MPKRLVLQTILLDRKGEAVRPTIGQPFDFSAAELEMVQKLNPDAVGKIVSAGGDDNSNVETISLTQADLDKEKADAVNASREQMEKDIRAQVMAELEAAKPAGDTQNGTAKPETVKTDKTSKTDKTAKPADGDDDI